MTLHYLLQDLRSHPGRVALVPTAPSAPAIMEWIAGELGTPITSVGRLVTQQAEFPSHDSVATLLGEATLLSDLDILFWPDLGIDALRLLRVLARSRPRIAAWPGPIRGVTAAYSEPGRRDYFEAALSDAVILELTASPSAGGIPFVERRIT